MIGHNTDAYCPSLMYVGLSPSVLYIRNPAAQGRGFAEIRILGTSVE